MKNTRGSGKIDPFVEVIPAEPGRSIVVERRVAREFPFEWHKHAEYELTLIEDSTGTRLVGDDVASYHSGDLSLLGPMLPHTWASLPADANHKATVVHFERAVVAVWPEAEELTPLLDAASRGLTFGGPGLDRVTETIRQLPHRRPLRRITSLLEVLAELATQPDITTCPISSTDVEITHDPLDSQIGRALQYVAEGYFTQMSQKHIADLVGLDPATFSRRFKRTVGRTFTRYVQETRVAEAARRLAESTDPITLIAFESGFGNLASFNRVFLQLKGRTPSEYRASRRRPPI